jgi:hypothetical protein
MVNFCLQKREKDYKLKGWYWHTISPVLHEPLFSPKTGVAVEGPLRNYPTFLLYGYAVGAAFTMLVDFVDER